MLFLNNVHLFWAFVFIVMIAIESMTWSLTTIWFASSALVLIFLSFFNISFVIQCFIFIIIALFLLIFTRPVFIKKLNINKVATNIEALTGKHVSIIDAIPENGKGTIKLNGIIWNAQAETGAAISSGTLCVVKTFEGNTAIVSPLS